MNKRGLSQVVTMILMILIVLVAVSIIWVVVRSTIESGVERVGIEFITIDMEIIGQSVFIDEKNISFKVKRNPGIGNVIGLKVILEDINGKEKLFDVENFIIQELETRDVTINNYRSEGLLDIAKISIAPVFSSDGREIIGNIADVYVVSGLEGGGGDGGVCLYGNNITNPSTCDIRLMMQGLYAPPYNTSELGLPNNAINLHGSALKAGVDILDLDDYLSYTENQIRAALINYLNNPARNISTNTTDLIGLDMEHPALAHPKNWWMLEDNLSLQSAVFNAFELRISVARQVLPNASLGLYGIIVGPSKGTTNSNHLQQLEDRMGGYRAAGEQGVYDKVDYFQPVTFQHFPPDNGNHWTMENFTRTVIEASQSLTNSTGGSIPLAPFIQPIYRQDSTTCEYAEEWCAPPACAACNGLDNYCPDGPNQFMCPILILPEDQLLQLSIMQEYESVKIIAFWRDQSWLQPEPDSFPLLINYLKQHAKIVPCECFGQN